MQEFTTERGKKQNATQCHHVTFNACIAEISPYQKPVMFEFFNCGSQLSQSCYLLKRLFKKQKACLFSKAIKFSSTFSQNHFLTLRKQKKLGPKENNTTWKQLLGLKMPESAMKDTPKCTSYFHIPRSHLPWCHSYYLLDCPFSFVHLNKIPKTVF